MTYLLAVLAACANATSSVLQRKAGQGVPQDQNLSPRLIWSLLHEPVWFGGVLAVTIGFLLQAAALGNGQLPVVEPILVLELPATLLLATRVFHSRLHRREWGAVAAMAAGLAVMLYALSPTGGQPQDVRWYAWAIGIGVNLAFIAAMVAWGRRGPSGEGPHSGRQSSALQAAVLAVGAGAAYLPAGRRHRHRVGQGPQPSRIYIATRLTLTEAGTCPAGPHGSGAERWPITRSGPRIRTERMPRSSWRRRTRPGDSPATSSASASPPCTRRAPGESCAR